MPDLAYQGRVSLKSALAGALSTALVISKSAVDRYLTLLLRERSRKKTKRLPLKRAYICPGSNSE